MKQDVSKEGWKELLACLALLGQEPILFPAGTQRARDSPNTESLLNVAKEKPITKSHFTVLKVNKHNTHKGLTV